MKNFISANIKYFKDNESQKDIKHIERNFFDDKNVYKELSNNNLSFNINDYNELKLKHSQSINKKISKNANLLIDCVVSFSFEQFDKIKNDKKQLALCSKKLINEIQKKYGFTPISCNFHFDEGHHNEHGKFINNYHAHFLFYNYDFKNKNAPLRKFRNNKTAFSKLQDICEESFKSLDFKRGVSKKITKKEHLEKNQYLEKLLDEKKEKIKQLSYKNDTLNEIIKLKRNYSDEKNLQNDKSQFIIIKNFLESQKFTHYQNIYNDANKNIYFRQLTRFINPLIPFFKKIYNSLHHYYFNKPSHFEIDDKIKLEKDISKILDDYSTKNKKKKRINSLFPKLTKR